MNAEQAYNHAKEVIKGRFPEAEATIATSARLTSDYEKLFNIESTKKVEFKKVEVPLDKELYPF